MKACRDCHHISENVDACPACGSTNLSKDFMGIVVVIDPKKSILADRMNIDTGGRYALKVR